MIENPFESGQIKNYLLLYASIVLIMILFFIASSFFNEIEDVQKKVFATQNQESKQESSEIKSEKKENAQSRFKLLERSY